MQKLLLYGSLGEDQNLAPIYFGKKTGIRWKNGQQFLLGQFRQRAAVFGIGRRLLRLGCLHDYGHWPLSSDVVNVDS